MAKKAKAAPGGPVRIPSYIVEYFLLGQTRKGAIERYTEDGGIVIDVWLAFATDIFQSLRVLVAPNDGVRTIDLAYALHKGITAYRNSLSADTKSKWGFPTDRAPLNVSPLENCVAVSVYLDELLHVVLPLTRWWKERNLGELRGPAMDPRSTLRAELERTIRIRLGRDDEGSVADVRSQMEEGDHRVIEAAPIAALVGVFCAAAQDPSFIKDPILDPSARPPTEEFLRWVRRRAPDIAKAATDELLRPFDMEIFRPARELAAQAPAEQVDAGLPALITRVFLNREAQMADIEAIGTVKADAATRLFQISCRDITWAIIDAGIDSTHPAFIDHADRRSESLPDDEKPRRVRSTFDFTLIHEIRSFDLTNEPRDVPIAKVATKLASLPGRQPSPEFEKTAVRHLNMIADQLNMRTQPDWSLIEPLIRIEKASGEGLSSSHGTHVAGILGGDWRRKRTVRPSAGAAPGTPPAMVEEIVLQGICPDIRLYDLRVVTSDRVSTEFGLLAALEYVQYVNTRSVATGPVIHGVNISLSIPHDVRNYGCGATPVCVACDRLAHSGVVVVAAAGNRGWNEQETGFGSFVFCSITDPGNAQHVITVGSTHRANPHTYGVSYFSSRGPTGDGRIKPDLVAPGEKIRGPVRGKADDRLDGTSMASPYVSGAAAMLMTRNRELIGNALRVKDILCRSATDLGREKYFQGHGLIDVLRALQSI